MLSYLKTLGEITCQAIHLRVSEKDPIRARGATRRFASDGQIEMTRKWRRVTVVRVAGGAPQFDNLG